MDFAAENDLRTRAYDVWHELSISPPLTFAEAVPLCVIVRKTAAVTGSGEHRDPTACVSASDIQHRTRVVA